MRIPQKKTNSTRTKIHLYTHGKQEGIEQASFPCINGREYLPFLRHFGRGGGWGGELPGGRFLLGTGGGLNGLVPESCAGIPKPFIPGGGAGGGTPGGKAGGGYEGGPPTGVTLPVSIDPRKKGNFKGNLQIAFRQRYRV